MKMFGLAVGAGLGYLAGNPDARTKAKERFNQWRESSAAKKAQAKLNDTVHDLRDKAPALRSGDSTEPGATSGSDSATLVAGTQARHKSMESAAR